MAIGNIMSGVVGIGKGAVSTVAGAASGMADKAQGGAGGLASSMGIDANDMLGPVNERLRAQGKPEVTASQLSVVVKDVAGTAVREGRFDRELLVSSLSQNTELSEQDAQDVAASAETQWNQKRAALSERVGAMGERAKTGALVAADKTGKAFWGLFGALFLGLCSAILGAITGVTRRQRELAGEILRTERPVEVRP
jgi:hypothetical protein